MSQSKSDLPKDWFIISMIDHVTNESIKSPHKCDLCGSTAIDHTEYQCSMNRRLRLQDIKTQLKGGSE